MRAVRGRRVAALLLALAVPSGCATPGGRDEVPEAIQELVAVWVIDVDTTLERVKASRKAAGSRPLAAATEKKLRAILDRLNTELGLNGDGTFLLKNDRSDAHGTVTVEGTWIREGDGVVLTGLRENGRVAVPPRKVRYRYANSRLVREGGGKETVHPVLKKGLVP